jgi:phenylacetic acid degradation operon negative regulatory protein
VEDDERRRPQQLLLAMLGVLVLDRREEPISSRVFIDVLGALRVSEPAARATLTRMAGKGLLERRQDGRVAVFALTDRALAILREARQRVRSPAPFTHADGEWTLLSYSLPESHRDVRHQLRARLTWAGFGALRDGLWIAPGIVDVAALLGDTARRGGDLVADGFVARPLPGTQVDRFVRRAWDLPALRAEHERFLRRWSTPPEPAEPVTQVTLLGADWLRLLRADPGLPQEHLPADWPAQASFDTYRTLRARLEPQAFAAFDELLASRGSRR